MIPLFKVRMATEAVGNLRTVLESGYIGQGPQVESFEARLGNILGHPVITTNSCTSAIDLALHMAGVGPGDEVITTPMTCTATNSPIITRGAIPVWADVDAVTGMINPVSVQAALTSKTRAIIGVNWGGSPLPLGVQDDRKQALIEDAAHCFGPTPHIGDYICWSFQAIKFLTCGDGGALATPASQLERARLLRWYGLDRRSSQDFRCSQNITEVGYKYHMNDIAASIGLSNIHDALVSLEFHKTNARYYHAVLKGMLNHVWLPPYDPQSCYWIFFIHTPKRAQFTTFMTERGIATSQVHARNDKHDGFAVGRPGPLGLPGLDKYAETYIAIPNGWWLTESDRSTILEALIDWDRTL